MRLTAPSTSTRAASRPKVALGVCIGTRAMGIAITTREQLVRAHTVTLHRLPAASRAAYVVGVLRRLVQAYGPRRIALVDRGDARTTAFVRRIWSLRRKAMARGNVVATRYTAAEIRVAQVGDHARPTTRNLGHVLGERFPEIARRLRLDGPATAQPVWSTRARLRTDRERYFARTLLALGGALHDLDEELKASFIS